MTTELTLKILALAVSSFGAWKLLKDVIGARRSSLREEYRFAREFFADMSSQDALHPYVRDKGYEALVGTISIGASEIEYLVSLPEPARSLREYVQGKKYLEHASTAGNRQISLKKRYRSRNRMRLQVLGYFLAFVVSYAAMMFPMLFPSVPHQFGLRVSVALPITMLLFGPVTYYFLVQGLKAECARMLIHRENMRPG
ncbi:MAG: hypothetical protein AB7G13_28545 [Lautropia sp.]